MPRSVLRRSEEPLAPVLRLVEAPTARSRRSALAGVTVGKEATGRAMGQGAHAGRHCKLLLDEQLCEVCTCDGLDRVVGVRVGRGLRAHGPVHHQLRPPGRRGIPAVGSWSHNTPLSRSGDQTEAPCSTRVGPMNHRRGAPPTSVLAYTRSLTPGCTTPPVTQPPPFVVSWAQR